MTTRKFLRTATAMAALAGIGLAGPSLASASSVNSVIVTATAPYCGIHWGSMPQTRSASGVPDWFTQPADGSAVDNVRAGRHDCYDRLVIDVLGSRPGYRVQYVDALAEYGVSGRGPAVPLLGGAFLEVMVPTNIGDADGYEIFTPPHRNQLVNVAGWSTFRQVVEIGYYETQRQFGLGVRGRLPFRVFTLDGPDDHSRLVIDVAHRW